MMLHAILTIISIFATTHLTGNTQQTPLQHFNSVFLATEKIVLPADALANITYRTTMYTAINTYLMNYPSNIQTDTPDNKTRIEGLLPTRLAAIITFFNNNPITLTAAASEQARNKADEYNTVATTLNNRSAPYKAPHE